jgi:hypothetical protein
VDGNLRGTFHAVISTDQLREAEAHGHSLFGASGWKRKLLCPGSLLAELGKPDTSGYDAAEGTVYHRIAEAALRGQRLPYAVGSTVRQGRFDVLIKESNIAYAQMYVDGCMSRPGVHFIEEPIDISPWCPIPKQFGIADFAACSEGHLDIEDLKFGTGVQVFAEWNEQAAGYALGFVRKWGWLFDFKTVTIRICQPRLNHFDEWNVSVEELEAFGEKIKTGLAKAWQPDSPRVPSNAACMFCRARVGCYAVVALAERLMDGIFEDETVSAEQGADAVAKLNDAGVWIPPVVRGLSTDDLETFLSYRKLLEDTLRDVQIELQRRHLAGEPLREWYMAAGMRSREVKSQKAIAELAALYDVPKQKLTETKFLSAAKLEELFVAETGLKVGRVKAILEPYIEERPGNPVLAHVSSGRKRAVNLADASFEDETQDI